MAELKRSKIIAGFLAILMIAGILPMNIFTTVLAAEIESYSIRLTDGSETLELDDVAITLTNKEDETKTETANTIGGIAEFQSFVEEEATYILSIAPIFGYEDFEDVEFTVAVGETSMDITSLKGLEKITVSGTVFDDSNNPYEGATVKVSGYVEAETTTGEDGTYSFETYAGKTNNIEIAPKEDNSKYKAISASESYDSDTVDVNYTFEIKNFSVNVYNANTNASISKNTIAFNESLSIDIVADTGYRIEKILINGEEDEICKGAKDNQTYSFILENINIDYEIAVYFYRQTYKVKFTVGENGELVYGEGENDIIAGGNVDVEKIFNESTDPDNPAQVVLTATPSEGYRVSSITVDNEIPKTFTENSYVHEETLEITKDHTFSVTFAPNEYVLTFTCGENGSANWDGFDGEDIKVTYGDVARLNITANEDYEISVLVNDIPIDIQNDYNGFYIKFTEINEDKIVKVQFGIPDTITTSDLVSNEYYVIEFYQSNGEKLVRENAIKRTEVLDDYTEIVLSNAVDKVTIKPNTDKIYNVIKYVNDDQYVNSIEIHASRTVNKLNIAKQYSEGYVTHSETLSVNLIITIDRASPSVNTVNDIYSNEDSVTISGKVTDFSGSSGLDYIVWSKDTKLEAADVLAAADTNKVAIEQDGVNFVYSFNVEGEQNSTYYVYAVDCAGNISVAREIRVVIDKVSPSITGFEFYKKDDSAFEDEIQFLNFGTFYKEDILVKISASDASAGVEKIELYKDGAFLATGTVDADGNAVFELTEDKFAYGGAISAVACDNAGNASAVTTPADEGVTTNSKNNNILINSAKPTADITINSEIGYTDEAGNRWFKSSADFYVEVKDEISGIKAVEILLNGERLTNDSNGIEIKQDFVSGTEACHSYSCTINTTQVSKEGKNTITVIVTNAAGQSVEKTIDVYVDSVAPTISVFELNPVKNEMFKRVLSCLSFGNFTNDLVIVNVSANDYENSSGVKEISLFLNNDIYETKEVKNNKATFVLPTSEIAILPDGYVFNAIISAAATDNVGNTCEAVLPSTVNSDIKDSNLVIENIAPIVSIVPSGNAVMNDGKIWYSDDIDFNITASDEHSGIGKVVVTVNGTELVYDEIDEKLNEKEYIVNTSDSMIESDGSYSVVVTVTDNAGNIFTSDPYIVYKDVTAPNITKFDFDAIEYVEGAEAIEDMVVSTDYGFYFKADTWVIISANDIEPSSGIKSITYYTVDYTNDPKGVVGSPITVSVNADNQIAIIIPANFKGQIYAKATDNVLNVTNQFANPNGAIVESESKHNEEEHIIFEKPETKYTTSDNTPLYSDAVDVTITVVDTYSGIREIEWSVAAPYDTDYNQSGKVILNNNKSFAVGSETDWIQTKTENNLVTEMKKTITVSNNSNNIIVTVKMTDRAGNISEETLVLSIDKVNPAINIVYDEDEVSDREYTDFFNTKRTAIVTITERNFDPSDVDSMITRDGNDIVIVDLNSAVTWTTTEDSVNPDNTIHVATIEYIADGDYTFDISYVDGAGRAANVVKQHKFTIDMTKPIVSVAYDNNSAVNGNYYAADRIATITIKEHNFDENRVEIIGFATDDGVASAFPIASAWQNNGDDTYTATIAYTSDSRYSFDIELRDKANNSIDNYETEEFYVDKTAPQLSISGIADKSANNGDVIPVVTYSDTNYNKDTLVITLSGVNNGIVDYAGHYSDTASGQSYTYSDFEKIQKVDDIYTLTAKIADMAGNEAEMTITFSVNRFGSVYDLSEVENIISKYLQTEKDIVFTETNVDALDREAIKIKITKNGIPTDLTEGVDYTVEMTGGEGQWSVYKYTVNKELFADDGRYSLSIYSKDAAGNVNENIDESKTAEISFGIDKTNPVIVPIDFESNEQYAVDTKTVYIEIKDNLVLNNVKIYLNGNEVEYSVEGESYIFDIPQSNSKQNVKIVAVDSAGNEETIEITGFLVNTNVFVRWFNNTPLFIGSIIGVVLLVIGIIVFVLFKKKKDEDK